MSAFRTKLAGVTHLNDDGSSRQEIIARCAPGEPVFLHREPENRVDANAIAVLRTSGEQLGYLLRTLSGRLAADLDSGTIFHASITEITGGTADKPTRGVNLVIERTYGSRAVRRRARRATLTGDDQTTCSRCGTTHGAFFRDGEDAWICAECSENPEISEADVHYLAPKLEQLRKTTEEFNQAARELRETMDHARQAMHAHQARSAKSARTQRGCIVPLLVAVTALGAGVYLTLGLR